MVRSDLIVGIANGIIFGFLCGFIITLIAKPILQTSPLLGKAVGLVIVFAIGVASVIGSTAPILFLRADIDPAISVGPFITVTNDIAGIAIYLLTTSYIYSVI